MPSHIVLASLRNCGRRLVDGVRTTCGAFAHRGIGRAYSALPITTVRQDVDEMSRLAVEELVRMMEGKPCRRKNWIVPVSLVRRETT